VRFLKGNLNNDRRRAPRFACDVDAWIKPEGSFTTQKCRLLDFSKIGVRLSTPDARKIPNKFLLLLDKTGMGREASVRWRRGTQIGAELSTATMNPRVTGATAKVIVSVVAGGTISAGLLISMYELAGFWGATAAFSAILIFVALRLPVP
jgi:hypothetical protein